MFVCQFLINCLVIKQKNLCPPWCFTCLNGWVESFGSILNFHLVAALAAQAMYYLWQSGAVPRDEVRHEAGSMGVLLDFGGLYGIHNGKTQSHTEDSIGETGQVCSKFPKKTMSLDHVIQGLFWVSSLADCDQPMDNGPIFGSSEDFIFYGLWQKYSPRQCRPAELAMAMSQWLLWLRSVVKMFVASRCLVERWQIWRASSVIQRDRCLGPSVVLLRGSFSTQRMNHPGH